MIHDINLLIQQRSSIIESCVKYQKRKYSSRTRDYDKCRRDLNYILEAMLFDVENDTTHNTIYIGNKFWIRNQRQISAYEVELDIYNKVCSIIEDNGKFSDELVKRVKDLVAILSYIIKHGPMEEPNSWHHNASLRINTYNWLLKVPKVEEIKGILEDLHNYSPSKQKMVRYHIDVYRNDNEENKKKIYRAHAASKHKTKARHNPQVLAPWLLFFRPRDSATLQKKYRAVDFYMDLGIATSNIIYSAASRGLDTGISKCINYNKLIVDVIGYVPELVIGIGYRNNDRRYMCLHYNKIMEIPDYDVPKPEMDEYIRYV